MNDQQTRGMSMTEASDVKGLLAAAYPNLDFQMDGQLGDAWTVSAWSRDDISRTMAPIWRVRSVERARRLVLQTVLDRMSPAARILQALAPEAFERLEAEAAANLEEQAVRWGFKERSD